MAVHVDFFSYLLTHVSIVPVSTRSLVVNAIAFAISGLSKSLFPRLFRRRRMKASLLSFILYCARVSLSRLSLGVIDGIAISMGVSNLTYVVGIGVVLVLEIGH